MADPVAEQNANWAKLHGFGLRVIAGNFSTNGSGVATLDDCNSEHVTVAKGAGNDYTVTFGECVQVHAAIFAQEGTTTKNDVTDDATAGTATVTFSGAFNSSRCDFIIVVESSSGE